MTYDQLSERIKTINDEVITRKATHGMLDELLDNAKQVDHISAQVHILAAKGQLLYFNGETKKAFDLLFNSYSLAIQINDIEALTRAQYNLGTVYASMGLYEHAFQYLIMALESAQKNNLEPFLGGVYNNIGACLFKLDMVEESGKYCKCAYDHFSDKKHIPNHVFTTLNMTVYLMRIGQLETAEEYLKSVVHYMDQLPPLLVWGMKMNYARFHAYKGEYQKSLEEMNKIYEEFFSEKTEASLYDQVYEWCNIFESGNKLCMTKEFLKKIISNIKDDQSATVAELMLILAMLCEENGEYQKSSKLFRKSVSLKNNFYKQNQQYVAQNALKLIEMTKKNRELAKTSYRDALTSCFNRHALASEGQKMIDKAVELNHNIAVIMFDIDYFKQFNDYYGHLEGDKCIKDITEVIRKIYPEEYRGFYRYGGDEFLILWPFQENNGNQIAKKMLDAVRAMKLLHKKSPVSDIATISIGVSTLVENNTILQNAIDAADMNLYKAKFNKRNCACVNDVLMAE
jgi:diguanylate cyclase (GGDEF)-like protein